MQMWYFEVLPYAVFSEQDELSAAFNSVGLKSVTFHIGPISLNRSNNILAL